MATKKVDFIVSEKGTSKAAGGFKKVDNSIAKAAKSAALYAGAYIGARGIINLTKNAIEAFGVQEDAEKRLTTALGKNADALIKQAGALQQVSTFGDEVIIGVQASIAAFVRDEGAIKRATAATLDLAAATGMDLKSAGDLVAKSLGSSTNALSRYGIEVTGAVGSSERLDTLTGNIASKFAGQAAAAADTMAGKMQQASNAIGDASEALGETFAEPVRLAAEGIKFLAEGMNAFIASVGGVGGHVTTAEQRLSALNKLVNEHADISIPNLIQIYTMLGMGYDDNISRGDNFKRVLGEQADAQMRVNDQAVIATETIVEQAIVFDTAAMASRGYVQDLEAMELAQDNVYLSAQDLATNIQRAYLDNERYIDSFTHSMIAATVEGQDMKDALISATKAITIELIANWVKRQAASLLGLGAMTAANTAAAVANGAAWATPAALASTATFGGAAVAGGAALAATVAEANLLAAFADGGDFVTNGPQLMMVGEAGREHVSVTPLEGPNINGPQGGATFNFYGNITDKEYVRGFLIPEFLKASRLGYA